MIKGTPTLRKQKGFTIIELMIATLIFSTVLVLLTTGVLYFTNMYYKSVNLTLTQNTARQIANNISQAIQFSGGTVSAEGTDPSQPTVKVICIGSKRYSYIPGKQVIDSTPNATQTRHALVVDTATPCQNNQAVSTAFATTGSLTGNSVVELIGARMRLNSLVIQQVGSTAAWNVTVSISYGDSDLFTTTTGADAYKYCKSGEGSQFCGAASLTTTVQRRIENG